MLPDIPDFFEAETRRVAAEHDQRWRGVLDGALEALSREPANDQARIRAANALRKLNRHGEAIGILQNSPEPSADLYDRLIELLAECNRTTEAIETGQAALRKFPGDAVLSFAEALLLPVLYSSTEEIDRYRARFTDGLSRLSLEIRLDSEEDRDNAVKALAGYSNFYLGYQCRNDRELRSQYGALAHRIMSAAYPEWTTVPAMPSRGADEPVRVGYVSARFRDLSATRFFLGWLEGHDPSRVSVFSWHLGSGADAATLAVANASKHFAHFPDNGDPSRISAIAASIRAADLHVLVFIDIGIEGITTQLAALRLAPVQCMAWDQPVTSGLPTVDYALSSDLTEPPSAAEQYAERLIRLPGVGVSYAKPAIPWILLRKTRQDFGLREDAVVYLCCQSVFKFLPGNDDVFAGIAKRVPNAQFVFLVTMKETGAALLQRLAQAFAASGIRAEDHCIMLPQQPHHDYWNLHKVGDIFLDTIGWSSGGSVFEAVACGVPVVTLCGDLMRGRQGAAILEQLGVTDTVAYDKAGYIDCAVRVGLDESYRREIADRMAKRHAALFSDQRSITALEDFFEEITSAQ